jgi:hypothetical protein
MSPAATIDTVTPGLGVGGVTTPLTGPGVPAAAVAVVAVAVAVGAGVAPGTGEPNPGHPSIGGVVGAPVAARTETSGDTVECGAGPGLEHDHMTAASNTTVALARAVGRLE